MRFFRSFALAAALAIVAGSSVAQTHGKTTLRVCTGSPAGNYTFAANEIAKRVSNTFDVKVINTAGSLDNLRRLMANECDMGFAQSDVTDLFVTENAGSMNTLTRFTRVYDEYIHLLCPVASGWNRVNDIGKAGNKARIIVGPDGSGSAETWRALRRADEGLYSKIERIPDPVNTDAMRMVKDSTNTCLLWVSGLNSPDMQAANRSSVNTRDQKPSLRLIDVNDRDFKGIKAGNGQPMYAFKTIERAQPKGDQPGLYNNLIEGGWFSGAKVEVPTVEALLMVRTDWRDANRSRTPSITQAVEDASPTIWRRVNP